MLQTLFYLQPFRVPNSYLPTTAEQSSPTPLHQLISRPSQSASQCGPLADTIGTEMYTNDDGTRLQQLVAGLPSQCGAFADISGTQKNTNHEQLGGTGYVGQAEYQDALEDSGVDSTYSMARQMLKLKQCSQWQRGRWCSGY